MRIYNKKDSGNLVPGGRRVNKNRIAGAGPKEFPDVLQKFDTPAWDGGLEELLDRLDQIGQRLVNSFSIYDLKEYKDTLRNFLKETQGKTYQLKEERGWSRQGRPKSYQSLELIDRELEELSSLVLNKQRSQLKILEKLDHIRGLLIDLYS